MCLYELYFLLKFPFFFYTYFYKEGAQHMAKTLSTMKDSSFFVAQMLDVPIMFWGIVYESVGRNCVVCGSNILPKFFKISRRGQNEGPSSKAIITLGATAISDLLAQ